MRLTIQALAGLNEVLLQAALRVERGYADPEADKRASELAKRFDRLAAEVRQ